MPECRCPVVERRDRHADRDAAPGRAYRLTVVANDFESDVPAFVLPEHAPGWMPHLGDPAALFGLGDEAPSRSGESSGRPHVSS